MLYQIFKREYLEGCQIIPLLYIFHPWRMDLQMKKVLVIDFEWEYLDMMRWHHGAEGFFKSLHTRPDRVTKFFLFAMWILKPPSFRSLVTISQLIRWSFFIVLVEPRTLDIIANFFYVIPHFHTFIKFSTSINGLKKPSSF